MAHPGADASVVVEQVRPEVTYGLRAEVLRPGLRPLQARFPGDAAPEAMHFAVYDPAGRIVGVAAVLPEASPDGQPGWGLRGMAVDPALRRSGVGRSLVAGVVDAFSRAGGGLLWCKARLPAVPFYAALGFVADGEPWEDPAL